MTCLSVRAAIVTVASIAVAARPSESAGAARAGARPVDHRLQPARQTEAIATLATGRKRFACGTRQASPSVTITATAVVGAATEG